MTAKFFRNLRACWDEFRDTVALRQTNRRLMMENTSRGYQIDALESKLRFVQQQYDVVRQEALRAEQVITGVQHHLRDFPNDTSRAVKNMLDGR